MGERITGEILADSLADRNRKLDLGKVEPVEKSCLSHITAAIEREPMRIAKFLHEADPTPGIGLVEGDRLRPLASGFSALSTLLHSGDVEGQVRELLDRAGPWLALSSIQLLAPMDLQEVWGAGVTYERSKVAREEESETGGSFYDLVYRAPRPELFLKATPSRVVGPGKAIRVRRDSKWCVPEPELALVLAPDLRIVGFTVGNDVSARDIEGVNPLYLPQAKVYEACCALGPVVTLASSMPPLGEIQIKVEIERKGEKVFEGGTSFARMVRKLEELVGWLGIDNVFPDGVILLTGTGVVPPDEFSLIQGDVVTISIDGIGSLTNPVVQG